MSAWRIQRRTDSGVHIEICRDLRDRQLTPTRDGDHITLEVRRESLRHGEILSLGTKPTQKCQPDLQQSPSSACGVSVVRFG
jgi:hypothetical protein